MRKLALVLTLSVVSMLFVDGVAVAAANTRFVNFEMQDLGFDVLYSGRIDSGTDRCLNDRKIKVVHKGVLIATTRTTDNGSWTTVGPKPPDGDQVTAKVTKKTRRGRLICRGDSITRTFREAD